MFHVLHKVDICVCYARRKINFSLPLQTTQTQSSPCLASFKNVFHLEQLFLINLCHAFAISIIYCRIFHFFKFFDNTYCAYLHHYCQLQKSIDSHFLPQKLFFRTGAYLYSPYSFFCMISYDLTVGGV